MQVMTVGEGAYGRADGEGGGACGKYNSRNATFVRAENAWQDEPLAALAKEHHLPTVGWRTRTSSRSEALVMATFHSPLNQAYT